MSDRSEIRILLVDDHPLVRDGLRARLENIEHFRITGEAGNVTDALKMAAEGKTDLVLMDINLGAFSGIHLTARFSKEFPDIAIIMLSMHDKAEYISQSMQAGARAYVLKDAPADDIINAIETVTAGGSYFSSGIIPPVSDQRNALLTQRELGVLKSIASGKSNKHIARDLGLSVRTVETHRLNIKRKLNIDSQADLIRYALDQIHL